jgi:spore coat protein U-like protein
MTWVCEADERAATLRAHEADAIASLTPEDAMNRRLAVSLLTAATLALALAAGPARAGSATNDLTVTATVLGSCTIAPATLAFGAYDPAGNKDASAPITVSCTSGTTYWIGLGLGNNGNRTMAGGTAESLAYELYRDVPGGVVWDNAVFPVSTANTVGAGVAPYTTTVHGRITAGQIVSTGAYSDTVTMTVNF